MYISLIKDSANIHFTVNGSEFSEDARNNLKLCVCVASHKYWDRCFEIHVIQHHSLNIQCFAHKDNSDCDGNLR